MSAHLLSIWKCKIWYFYLVNDTKMAVFLLFTLQIRFSFQIMPNLILNIYWRDFCVLLHLKSQYLALHVKPHIYVTNLCLVMCSRLSWPLVQIRNNWAYYVFNVHNFSTIHAIYRIVISNKNLIVNMFHWTINTFFYKNNGFI